MPPNFAENRKPHQLEGSPVIHQRMTIQLFVPILWWGHCSGQLRPTPPSLAGLLERAGLDFALSPLEAVWPDSVGAKFLFILPGFFWGGEAKECGVL